jgi:DNA polymerase-3 subunit gamma/tau
MPAHYQVIARKYRPQKFTSVVGQEAIVTTLKNALRYNRLAHAYLFSGCRGTGKTTLARVFAKALNCKNPSPDFEPCNTCSSCLDIMAGRSLDVLEIDGASNRGIDDIRQINETIGYAPASGKYKIYIIDEVHMLTKEAFNALLKTLEEPPANVKFFFATTEPHKVLPTIISRCQRFDLNRIPSQELKKKLAWIAQDLNIDCEEDVFSLIANLSEGSLRDAESLLDQIICYAEHPITAAKVSSTLGVMPRTAFFALDKAFEEQNLAFAFELANEIFSSGKDLSYFVDNLIEHYRSLLKLKLHTPVTFPTAKLREQYASSHGIYTEEQCLYILEFLMHWQQQIGKTPFKRVSLEMILVHIIRSKQRITLPALVKRLIELEQKLGTGGMSGVTEKVEKVEPEKLIPIEKEATPSLPVEPVIISSSEHDVYNSSLEEALLKKIKEKIESSPPLVEEKLTPVSEETKPSLLLSKSQWESVANNNKQTQSPIPEVKAEKPVNIHRGIQKLANGNVGASDLQQAQPLAKQGMSKHILDAASCKDEDADEASGQLLNHDVYIPAPSQSRYDTLIRFASVELEGIIKKENFNG